MVLPSIWGGWKDIYLNLVLSRIILWNSGDPGSIPGLGRSPGEGKGYPLQYSGLENSIQSMGSQRMGHDLATKHAAVTKGVRTEELMEEISHGCYNQTKLERIPFHSNVTRTEDLFFCVLRWTLLNKKLIFLSCQALFRLRWWCLFDEHEAIFFFFLAMLCGLWDPGPWSGIEPMSPALEAWSLNHWTTREVPRNFLLWGG